jgi:hypothetical protein
MRQLLKLWTKDFGVTCERFCNEQLKIRDYISNEFVRKPTKFTKDYTAFKATELRQIMLYTGPILLKNLLHETCYNNFLLIHMAIRILCSPTHYERDNDLAEQFLVKFVAEITPLYGAQNVSFNVHNTIHLPNEARLHGPLDSFSAFQFENFMGSLKGLVKRYAYPLQQMHNRIHEHQSIIGNERKSNTSFKIFYAPNNLNAIVKIKTNNFLISTNPPDNHCMVNDNVFVIEGLVKNGNSINVIGRYVLNLENLYEFPEMQSNLLGIFRCENILLSPNQHVIAIENIGAKVMKIIYNLRCHFLTILHSDKTEDLFDFEV